MSSRTVRDRARDVLPYLYKRAALKAYKGKDEPMEPMGKKPNRLARWFRVEGRHPAVLHDVLVPVKALADEIDGLLPESAEKTAGMRKLLEARDCFARARIEELEDAGRWP